MHKQKPQMENRERLYGMFVLSYKNKIRTLRFKMANLWKIWVLNFGINIIFTIILWNGKDFGWLNASCQVGLITLILYINKEKL